VLIEFEFVLHYPTITTNVGRGILPLHQVLYRMYKSKSRQPTTRQCLFTLTIISPDTAVQQSYLLAIWPDFIQEQNLARLSKVKVSCCTSVTYLNITFAVHMKQTKKSGSLLNSKNLRWRLSLKSGFQITCLNTVCNLCIQCRQQDIQRHVQVAVAVAVSVWNITKLWN
jgi:hypothetical protein